MLFSIVMPIYKTDKETIKRALNSILNQSYTQWELFIVDDNMKNSSYKDIVRMLKDEISDPRIQFIIGEDNYGANHARNIGVNAAQGDWCAFLDADDTWEKSYLLDSLKIINNNPEVDLISSSYKIVTRNREVKIKLDYPKGNYYLKELERDRISPTSAVMVRRKKLLSIGGFDEKLPARQDYDTWLRLAQNSMFAFNPNYECFIYRDGHASISTNYMNHVKGTLLVLDKIRNKVMPNEFTVIAQSHYIYIANYCLQFNDFKLAKEYATKCSALKESKRIILICNHPKLYLSVKKTLQNCARLVKKKR